jgi:hypothetical protein
LRRVFVQRALVAAQYRVPSDSLRVFLYYPARVKYLLFRSGRLSFRLLRGDAALTSMAARSARMQRFLSDDPDSG